MSKIKLELEFKKGKTIDDLGDIADGINEIKSGAKGAEQGVGKFSKSFQAITKASGIVFLVEKAFELLKETLGKNQKVLDVFNTAFEALSIAFNDFFNFLDNNVGTVIDYFKGIFSDPQQALKDLGNAIKDNLIERFNSALEVFGYLGTAIKKVFQGDFDGAMEAAKNAGKEYVDVLTGVDDSVDKIVEGTKEITSSITEYAKSTIKAAQSTVELNKQAEIAAVINQGLIEKYDRQAEQQRQLRDDETKTLKKHCSKQ
jgi:prophage DNA circulation protein